MMGSDGWNASWGSSGAWNVSHAGWGGGGWGAGDRKGKDGKGGKGGKGYCKSSDKGGGMPTVQAKFELGERMYDGQISKFDPIRRKGFIVSEAATAETGQEVYIHQEVMERAWSGPEDKIAFFVHWSSRGQAQASFPCVRLSTADGSFAHKGVYKKSTDPSQNSGFIECAAMKEFFGRDVYVSPEIAAAFTEGQSAAFSVLLSSEGMPHAEKAQPCDSSWEPAPPVFPAPSDMPKGFGGKKGGSDWGAMASSGKGSSWDNFGAQDSWADGYSTGNGYSAGDAYSSSTGYSAGSGAQGHCQGADWQGCGEGWWGYAQTGKDNTFAKANGKGKGKTKGGPPTNRPTPTGRMMTGRLKSFSEGNGYGFIDCAEVRAEYGNDVFVAAREINGCTVGNTVVFEVALNTKGQPQAIDVRKAGVDGGGFEPPAKRQRWDMPSIEAGCQPFVNADFSSMAVNQPAPVNADFNSMACWQPITVNNAEI
eukprot:TRINITY_DN67602_c0_g1_i1.p1 TRINITY_DN67602_c0_g1~~TRINITY_DN67602_c0_g1_i1.p1  ORF type:complete len:507 (-),score=77.44 TRINITY_DN67602_c0_g1_i1:68-1504(-)